uniref:FLYWCH-type domain-containing protein n=1 Tax=Panagrellus redivivus TaxID=6233 RepID=A0A7E4ZXF9_PANRE
MVSFFEYPGLTNRETQMINLPSGPLQLPTSTTYTLMGVYDASTNEVNNLRIAHGVSREGDTTSNTAHKAWSKCMRKDCTFRMMSMQNADQIAVFKKGEHNHVVRPSPWRPKPINDPATIDATIDEVIEKVRLDGHNDESAVNDAAANVPVSSKAPRQPIARGMGQRRKKKKTVKKWNIRTPFDNFEALVAHLMAHGATPHRRPRFKKGKINRYYRCQHCSYVALSRRSENLLEKCVLYETRKHLHKVATVPPEHLHLYLEVPDPLPRRIPPGTVIVIDSDDEYSADEAVDGVEANVMDNSPAGTDDVESHFTVDTAVVRGNLVDEAADGNEVEEDAIDNAPAATNHQEVAKVSTEHFDLYLEVPDPLPRCVPPGTVIVIDSDDELLSHDGPDDGEAEEDVRDNAPTATNPADSHVTNEIAAVRGNLGDEAIDGGEANAIDDAPAATDHVYPHVTIGTAVVRCKAPLVDYPDSDDAMDVDALSNDAPAAVHGADSHVETAEEEQILTAINALCRLFKHRAKVSNDLNAVREARGEAGPTTGGLQNTDPDLVREAFGEIDSTFKGYDDLKKMVYKVIPDAPKPPRRRKQARPMKVEYHPPHGALSVWMARLRRLQDAVDQFVDETRTERRERKATSSTSL